MTNLLDIQNLQLSFGQDDLVLKGINLQIKPKEIVAIVGESGSGKSVTALSILQLLNPEVARYAAGNIFINANTEKALDILKAPESSLQKVRGAQISIVFQNPMSALNPSIRCGEQVGEMIALHHSLSKDEIKQRVLELFSKVKLPDIDRVYRSYPHQLSGGQLQRVMIAMAVANRPALIIADEPTTALDVTIQKEILGLLRTLQQENDCAILFISHDLGLVRELADRVIVMYQGNIVEDGLVDQVFDTPKHPYTKGLLACRPPLDKKLHRLPVLEDFLETEKVSTRGEIVSHEEGNKSESKVVLEVKDLQKYFVKKKSFFGKPTAYTKAVDEVSFTVRKGESLALVGESGSGKSTIGNCILSLVKKDQGTILFDGEDIDKMGGKAVKQFRKRCQVIFQNPYASLNPRIKIGEAIREPIIRHQIVAKKDSKARVLSLLERVGLEADHYDRYPHEFSGGQQQRINIARALSVNPEFIICDECVSALDVSVQAKILNLLKDLQEEFGLSYLFITHDFSVVRFLCDRAIVLKEGKIVESGTVKKIIDEPSHPYTKQLIESIV